MEQIPEHGGFDQLAVKRAVQYLSRTGVRSPLTVERIKPWIKQFHSVEEKTLAWLILRNLIFRTNNQFLSSMRQALKHATNHFIAQLGTYGSITWNEALNGNAGLSFSCGPPSLATRGPATPGRSGELVARLINQQYCIAKHFPSDISVLEENERFIIVDDGTYTGTQLTTFLRSWDINFSTGRTAIAVAIAHEDARNNLRRDFPNVPLFYGELLTADMCFQSLSQKWIDSKQWSYSKTPLEVYREVHERNKPFSQGNGADGYGDIGALVAFEHGIPDDSIQLLWDTSSSWKPLVGRGI